VQAARAAYDLPAPIDLVSDRPLDLSDMIADALGVTPQARGLWGAGSLSASLIKHFSGDHAQQLRSWPWRVCFRPWHQRVYTDEISIARLV
jgi:hypothetical protein